MMVRMLEDILCITVLMLTPDFLCKKFGVYTSCRRIMGRRCEIE